MKFLLLPALLALSGALPAQITLHVPGDHPTIQSAIDAVPLGTPGTVVIADGVYFENLDAQQRSLTLRSESGRPNDCIIDGGGVGTCLDASFPVALEISGLGFRGGYGTWWQRGGAVLIEATGLPRITLENCVFEQSTGAGGDAVSVFGSNQWQRPSLEVRSCVFRDNAANALRLDESVDAEIVGCRFTGQSSAILVTTDAAQARTKRISNSIFYSNNSHLQSAGPLTTVVDGCTFISAGITGGLVGNMVISNSILWGQPISSSIPTSYCNMGPGWTNGGPGSISLDPQFIDPSVGDLRLAATSPCIDAGSNAAVLTDSLDLDEDLDMTEPVPFDIYGEPRVSGAVVDMGAIEQPWTGVPSASPTIYVDPSASGTRDGTSWADATPSLRLALDAAAQGGVGEIRVAAGTYWLDVPRTWGDLDRSRTLDLPDGLAQVLGGFPPGGGPLSSRDPDQFPSIVSADLFRDDAVGGWLGENATTILTLGGAASTTVDGLVLTGGYGTGATYPEDRGGALVHGGTGSPTFRNCRFEENYAWSAGGAYLAVGGPAFEDCIFERNRALTGNAGAVEIDGVAARFDRCEFRGNGAPSGLGGAVALRTGATPTFTDCLFAENQGGLEGGALFAGSGARPSILRSTFQGNQATAATADGGALYLTGGGGALVHATDFLGNSAAASAGAIWLEDGDLDLAGCLLAGNSTASSGGALVVYFSSTARVDASTLANNTSGTSGFDGGGGIAVGLGGTLELSNSILWGNSDGSGSGASAQIHNIGFGTAGPILASDSTVSGGVPGGTNISAVDPGFADPSNGDYRPTATSSVLEAGNGSLLPADELDSDGDGDVVEPLAVDLDGNPRVAGLQVDQGAYEWTPAVEPWADLGFALPGTSGDPVLTGAGLALGGQQVALSLTNGLPGAPALWIVGAAPLQVPLLGGTLVPSPDMTIGAILDGAGEATLGGAWPAGATSGASIWFQGWMLDPGGVLGASASNGLVGTTP